MKILSIFRVEDSLSQVQEALCEAYAQGDMERALDLVSIVDAAQLSLWMAQEDVLESIA